MDNIKTEIETNKQCKCCLRTGVLQNLWSEYFSMGERENYGEMLSNCFALPWEPPHEASGEEDQHICGTCIQRLRDAYNFKKQILFSEELLSSLEEGVKVIVESNETIHYLEVEGSNCTPLEEYEFVDENDNDSDQHPKDDDRKADKRNADNTDDAEDENNADYELKLEKQELQSQDSREFENVEYLDDEIYSQLSDDAGGADNTVIVRTRQGLICYPTRKASAAQKSSSINKLRKKKHNKREVTRMYRQYTDEQLRKSVEAVMDGMPIGEASAKYNVPKSTINKKVTSIERHIADTGKPIPLEVNISDRPQKKFIEEIRTVLTYTNATPFKSMRYSQYSCAYCDEETSFSQQWESIKIHTRTQHAGERLEIDQILRPYFANEIIKVDISDFQCVVCPAKLETWNGMFIHLKTIHDIELDDAYTRIIPFVLTDYNCALCNQQMGNHMQLDSHMNAHYNNYMCEECGETFLSEQRLKNHLQIHSTGSYPCTECGKVFALEKYMRKHFKYVHTDKAYCCRHCTEVFTGEYQRHLHILAKHKEHVRFIQCELCEKQFHWRPYYYKHMRFKHKKNYNEQPMPDEN